MSVILRNEHGAVAVNKGVIERMIIEDILSLGDDIILCSKKGKPIGEKPSRFMDPDYLDAIELTEKKGVVRIKVFLITRLGSSISDIAEQIFERVENDYALLHLSRPGFISVNIRGVMSDQLIKRNIEVVRRNV
ncbi:MAG: hypothetical protein IJJ31_06080 [Mogibacterium sp.]|jgi:uncharacterized alkaline shock family protein YloU|nr:hypothetical protein [Mogibacterium sp.]